MQSDCKIRISIFLYKFLKKEFIFHVNINIWLFSLYFSYTYLLEEYHRQWWWILDTISITTFHHWRWELSLWMVIAYLTFHNEKAYCLFHISLLLFNLSKLNLTLHTPTLFLKFLQTKLIILLSYPYHLFKLIKCDNHH